MKELTQLTEKEATETLKNRIAFISEVSWRTMTIVVDGKEYLIGIDWKHDDNF